MRRFLVFLSLFLFSLPLVFSQDTSSQLSASISLFPSHEKTAELSPTDTLKKLKQKQLEIISIMSLEKQRIFDEVGKKSEIQTLLESIESSLTERARYLSQKSLYDSTEEILIREIDLIIQGKETEISQKIMTLAGILGYEIDNSQIFDQLLADYPSLKTLTQTAINTHEANIDIAEKKRQDFLDQKNKELGEINTNIEHFQELRSHQIGKTIQQFSWYLLIFIFIYVFRVISRSFLSRFSRGFSKSHREMLFLIHKWLFYILFFAALLMIFSAEFISFLPFIAILTTAIGFSLREVISSFAGWFVIEADSRYQPGDLIEIDTMTGRVKSITPLLTTIQEYGLQGFTGKIISFPNRTIFEKSIKNWSRGSDFLMISNDFLLTYESDIAAAKELLMEIVGYNALPQYYSSRREINLFKSIYNFTDADLKPQIHVLTDHKGIILRVRNLVHMKDKFVEQSRIAETFISRVQQAKNIAMGKI